MRWVVRLLMLGVVGYGGFVAYDLNRGGYLDLPDIPDGAYPISFASGLRGIVHDVEVSEDRFADDWKYFRRLGMANPDRRYLGIPADVPSWFKDTWSNCRPPTEEQRVVIESGFTEDMRQDLFGARFDAVCYIEADDGQQIMRGLIYSVPQT